MKVILAELFYLEEQKMRLGFIFIAVLALIVFVRPAWGATDTVDVTISIPSLSAFNAGADVTLTAVVADLNNQFIFSQDASTMVVKANTDAWTLTAQLDSDFTDYSLWVEDDKTSGNNDGSGFKPITASLPKALNGFKNYGDKGDHTYNLDWQATGVSWTSYQGNQTRTVTFTLTTS